MFWRHIIHMQYCDTQCILTITTLRKDMVFQCVFDTQGRITGWTCSITCISQHAHSKRILILCAHACASAIPFQHSFSMNVFRISAIFLSDRTPFILTVPILTLLTITCYFTPMCLVCSLKQFSYAKQHKPNFHPQSRLRCQVFEVEFWIFAFTGPFEFQMIIFLETL